jgi:malonyl-CoA decarboxylase
MQQCLDARGGEVLARSRAAALGRAYLALNAEGKAGFLRMLAESFDIDQGRAESALAELRKAKTPKERRAARRSFLSAAESPRTRILRRFNALPQGVKFLVDLRADLLELSREDPALASLDDDLKALLGAWFDVDFLQLRRISWNTASGALLEKFMAYEAVHPVESWEDLKDRLDHDRRYFAFFHPRMPDEPLIFVEVALVRGMAGNIQVLLDPSAPVGDPRNADTAVFYSISNAQVGLGGISFGGFLIKRVVDELAAELPHLKNFVTLSPIPSFRDWFEKALAQPEDVFLSAEIKRFQPWAEGDSRDWILDVLREATWQTDKELEKVLKPPLLRMAARYLTEEKRARGGALDPVAHFHLTNGAKIERLNWAADLSPRGLAQSQGIMVNYRYDSKKIEGNHEAYKGNGEISTASAVRSLLKG